MPSQTKTAGTIYSFLQAGAIAPVAWTNPTNAELNDGSYATVVLETGVNDTSEYLCFEDFGFTIPAGSQVVGFEFKVRHFHTTVGSGGIVGAAAAPYENSDPDALYAFYDGTINSTDTETEITFGSPTDLGDTSLVGGSWEQGWNATKVNDTEFGWMLQGVPVDATGDDTYSIDSATLTIHYEAAITDAAGAPLVFGGTGAIVAVLGASGGIIFSGSFFVPPTGGIVFAGSHAVVRTRTASGRFLFHGWETIVSPLTSTEGFEIG